MLGRWVLVVWRRAFASRAVGGRTPLENGSVAGDRGDQGIVGPFEEYEHVVVVAVAVIVVAVVAGGVGRVVGARGLVVI